MQILGIETSCDETAAAVVVDGWQVRSNVIASSLLLHKETGGVVPEVAARDSALKIAAVIQEAVEQANTSWDEIDGIAVTNGPGLLGSLLVGIEAAKTLALLHHKPLIPVFHIAGHLFSNILERNEDLQFPVLSLTVAGGHNDLYLWEEVESQKSKVKSQNNEELRMNNEEKNTGRNLLKKKVHTFRKLGGTIDDAAGEAFDKGARMLGLSYPGGPALSRLAQGGDATAIDFPRPMLQSGNYDFSFSGLKTALFYELRKKGVQGENSRGTGGITNYELRITTKSESSQLPDLAASYQEAIVDTLITKLFQAVDDFGAKEVHLAGGVSANKRLRERCSEAAQQRNLTTRIPAKMEYCTDNAAMIAAAGYGMWQKHSAAERAEWNVQNMAVNLEHSFRF